MVYSQRNVLPVSELVQGMGTPALLGDEIAAMTLLPADVLSFSLLLLSWRLATWENVVLQDAGAVVVQEEQALQHNTSGAH